MMRRALTVLTAVVAVAGCATPAAQESQAPSTSAAATPSARPSPSATPSSAPPAPTDTSQATAAPTLDGGFQYADILRVEVDGLAVREAPSVTSPLAQGYLPTGEGTVQPTGDIRLDAGYFVSVHLGPLRDGETVWYLVWPAVDARLNYNPGTWWDSDGNFATVGGVDPGWVAASVGDDQYLTLYRSSEPDEIGQFLPVGLTLSGTGNFESEPQEEGFDLFLFHWAVALNDAPSPCAFSVALLPERAAPLIAVDTSIADVAQGTLTGVDSQIHAPWGPLEAFTVSITSSCTWTIGLHGLGHD